MGRAPGRCLRIAAVSFALCACGGASDGDDSVDDAAAETGATTGDVVGTTAGDDTGAAAETGDLEADAEAGPADVASGDDPADDAAADAGPTEDPDAPVFVLGINETAKVGAEYFSELVDGGELVIEYGPQGLWMVVLAFKTRNVFEPPLQIIAKVEVGGVEQGLLGLGKQKLQYGGDGFDYFYNLYLVVDDPTVTGQAGLVSVEVTDDHGGSVVEQRSVLLTGGKID